jgi:hypothetical protein
VYATKRRDPIPLSRFLTRSWGHFAVAALVVFVSLRFGMWGYSHYEGLSSRDAFLNTAMLLGGMGPVNPPQTPAGKLFAGWFALYAGLVFLVVAGLIVTPLVHWTLHRLHWDGE